MIRCQRSWIRSPKYWLVRVILYRFQHLLEKCDCLARYLPRKNTWIEVIKAKVLHVIDIPKYISHLMAWLHYQMFIKGFHVLFELLLNFFLKVKREELATERSSYFGWKLSALIKDYCIIWTNIFSLLFYLLLCRFETLSPIAIIVLYIIFDQHILVVWLVVWALWHINLCRLFDAKSIFMQIISSTSNDSV